MAWVAARCCMPATSRAALSAKSASAGQVIFADIRRSFGRDAEHVATVLRALDSLSGSVLADLDRPHQYAVAARAMPK